MIKSLQFPRSSSFFFRTIANQLKFSSNFIKSLHTEFNLPFSHHITEEVEHAVSWKASCERKAFFILQAFYLQHCYLNQYMKFNRIYIEIGLKTFILCFFFFDLLHQHSPPLLYAFAVDVERQLSVESIFHRFQFHPMEICKGVAISSTFSSLNPLKSDSSRHFLKMLSKLHFSIYSREHLYRFWCRKFLFQSDSIL